jgi:hypothetical protein
MSTRLGDLLDNARRERFVGRHRQLASFDDALHKRSPTQLLFVHGEGGIGKTTLLLELRARARAAGRTVIHVDGRDTDPSPQGLAAAVRLALGPYAGDGTGASVPAGAVLLVDGYEQLAPIDGWLRDVFVPGLSTDNVVVLAGRDPPAAPWRTDPGWRHVVAAHRLDPFDPAESGELLANAGVDPSARSHLLRLGRGHPLTMALLADLAESGEVPDALADVPDLVSALLGSFLRDAPGEAHLIGLATCAIAWLTTEDLLREVVGADAAAVWQWLARQPFVTAGPRGLFIHDLARDVLDAELEHRSPERYADYRRIVEAHALACLRAAAGPDRQQHAQQMNFLLRKSPLTDAIAAIRARGSAAVVTARSDEHEQVCAIIEKFEGPASARLARAWLSEQPDRLSVVRAGEGVAGFAHHLLCPSGSALEDRDPVVRAVLDHVAREGPVRPGEHVDITRFHAGAYEHQRDIYAVLVGNVSAIIEWSTRPLAWSFAVTVDAGYWAPFFEYLAFARLVEADVGDLRHVVYGIDWRRVPFDAWLGLMRERGQSGDTGPPPATIVRPPALDRSRFAAAVRAALQTLHRPDQLAASPLMGSALAATPDGPDVAQLRATIENAVTCLGDEPKGDRLWAVLHRTYLRAAPTQEAAAEVLGLPMSTYRRYLAKALEQLTDRLWSVEIGEVHS